MIIELRCFEPPEDPEAKIWRYLDFTKYVDFLATSTLFFARADRLGDPFEGSWPKQSINDRERFSVHPERFPRIANMAKGLTRYAAINCWHVGEHESAAMWKLYLKTNEGIAIQSRYRALYSVLDAAKKAVRIGMVRYIDYESEGFEDATCVAKIAKFALGRVLFGVGFSCLSRTVDIND